LEKLKKQEKISAMIACLRREIWIHCLPILHASK
jgi:hypothetical protein